MRISLTIKVFILFSSLTAMTLVLSFVSYSGFKENQSATQRIVSLKEFLVQVEKLKTFTAQVKTHQQIDQKLIFGRVISDTQTRVLTILNEYWELPLTLRARMDGLPDLLNSYHKAFIELFEKTAANRHIPEGNRQIFEALNNEGTQLGKEKSVAFYRWIHEIWLLTMPVIHNHDISKFPRLKSLLAEMGRVFKNDNIDSLLEQLVNNLEIYYVNNLAIENRQQFLQKTSEQFFKLANDGIDQVQKNSVALQQNNSALIFWASLLAIGLNIFLWTISSRYFKRFIRTHKKTIQAIEADEDLFDFPIVANDEIGDLSLAMIELGKNLAKSKKRYRMLFNQAVDTILVLTIDGHILDVNQQACKSLGYDRLDLLNFSAEKIIGAEGFKANPENPWEKMNRGERVTIYDDFRRIDKTVFPVELRMGLIEADEYDSPEGKINIPEGKIVLVFARDISERKKAEKSLRESEALYRSMMETMQDPVYICSPDLRIEYVNPAMAKRIGSDAIGRMCYEVLHGLSEKCIWCRFDLVNDKKHYTSEIISPKDERAYHISSSPIVHQDGSISKLTICRDVTELKRLEVQLVQAQKMESIGTLAGGIAHDFNNILFPILGYTEMLLEDIPETSRHREKLEQVSASALRAKDLVRQILTFSRQELGELKLMQIQPVIKEALKLIRASIPATIDIFQDIPSECGPIKADPIQIHQVVMNLATNAYHAMQEKGGELKVILREVFISGQEVLSPEMKPGQYNCLTVSDTGIGMNKQLIEKIFDPYFTTKEKGKGTGMGLSVVHGIIKGMEGAMEVTSTPGKGSEFHIFFPVAEDVTQDHKLVSPALLQGGNEHLLVVDDEVSIVRMVTDILQRLGYRITAKNSSLEALKTFEADPYKYDLVMTDLSMPKMPGDELAFELLKIRSDIPIILNTGFSEQITPDLARRMGIKGMLRKPVLRTEMAELIRRLLDQQDMRN